MALWQASLLGALVWALISLAPLLGCGPTTGEEQLRQETSRVERRSIERIVVASGTIEPADLVEVRSKVSGIIERFEVEVGDEVEAGQIVAQLDRRALQAAVREQRAALDEVKLELDFQNRRRARTQKLLAEGVVTDDELDLVHTDRERAAARHQRAAAALDRLREELANATLRAPIDGVVLRRDLNPGAGVASVATVTGGTPVLTIADTSQLFFEGSIDENEIRHVRLGQPARIYTDAYPDRSFEGKVIRVSPLGERRNNVTYFDVEVELLEGADTLTPRLSADAWIVAEFVEDALALPETALLYDGAEVAVEVVQNGRPNARRRVEVGIREGEVVQILAGVEEGEEVVLH